MKRYEFRLAAVLRIRRVEEEQARETLAAANGRLRSLLLERDAQSRRYRELVGSVPATTVEGFLAELHAAHLAASVVARATRAVTGAAADAALAQVAWAGASRRVKLLERLDDRRRREHAEDLQRAEVAVVDDIVTARYVSAQRSRSPAGVIR